MSMQLPRTTYIPPQTRARVVSRNVVRNGVARVVSGPIPAPVTIGELQASAIPRSRNVSAGSVASLLISTPSINDSATSALSGSSNDSEVDQSSRSSTAPSVQPTVSRDADQPQTPTHSSTRHATFEDTEDVEVRLRPGLIQDPSPRVSVLTAVNSPLRLSNGTAVNPQKLLPMAEELETARLGGRFPVTTAPYMDAQAVMDDFDQLQLLVELEHGSREYTELYVENVRRIRERDSVVHHENHDAHMRHTIDNLMRNQDVGEDLHAIIRQAARNASANAVRQVLAENNGQSLHQNVVREVSQAVIRAMAEHGLVGGQAVDNVDDILEEMFGVVEARILDATGPLRLNVNNLRNLNQAHEAAIGDQINRIDQGLGDQINRIDQGLGNHLNRIDQGLGNHLNNLNTQVGAMNNHVSAVGNHVNALGAFIHAINNTVSLTNNQMGQFGNEINSLQQIANMLPTLVQQVVQQVVQQSVQQILPGAVQTALVQAISGAAHATNSKGSDITATEVAAAMNEETVHTNKAKKNKKRGFWARLFKGCKKDDRNSGAPPGMAC
ncbi:hypothetical protein BKA67DRAFT_663847 [Truncatella angustata]|uniref:Uncharacterized protein n=1 Tax=Truncatella angustata TaxID=152316 RepID=A0A9P8RM95_9PEZI|nr:uncharacterized protein BKA67DRAFT_663847 [Truncatella angustata]KAH6645975.1 hypothetical protein BKA67DRAFT_663847 [Truncatella angustata]